MNENVDRISSLANIIQNDIFEYNLNSVFEYMSELIAELVKLAENGDVKTEKIYMFNKILEEIVLSFENKDYLLLADILKFKLVTFIENI